MYEQLEFTQKKKDGYNDNSLTRNQKFCCEEPELPEIEM